MALPIKLIFSLTLFGVLSACASLPGGERKTSDSELVSAVKSAELRAAELEEELARIQAENDRLSSQLASLKQQKDNRAAASENLDSAEEGARSAAASTAADVDTPLVLAQKDSASIVVEEPGPSALKKDAVPVAPAPRMVQPTFAATDAVFENEANGDIETESVLFGVHLASYRKSEEAREGWRQLQRQNPDELGLLEPRVEQVTLPGKGVFLRLIGGGFSSQDKAAALCESLNQKGFYCAVSSFNGVRLALTNAG